MIQKFHSQQECMPICTKTNIYSSFIHNAKNWKQPKCPSEERITNCGTVIKCSNIHQECEQMFSFGEQPTRIAHTQYVEQRSETQSGTHRMSMSEFKKPGQHKLQCLWMHAQLTHYK
jgi:hypothetical protein